jgi:hypothetical protein
LHGMKMDAFVHPWLVMVRIKSKPCEIGNLTMKSSATILNGSASGFGYMGCRGAFVGRLLTLWC